MTRLEQIIIKNLEGQVADEVKQTMAVFLAADVTKWALEMVGEDKDIDNNQNYGESQEVGYNEAKEEIRERIKEG